MKTQLIATTTLLLLTASAASADTYRAYGYSQNRHVHVGVRHSKAGKLTPWERIRIARSRARLAMLRRRAQADSRITARERRRLHVATLNHRKLVRKELRD